MIRDEAALDYHSSPPAGKVAISLTKPCLTPRDLSLAYTPGVAAPCLAIQRDPLLAYRYTAKGNLVAVVTNGSAVLGLGNIGAAAAKPVMEGKAVLFKRFADIDAFDIELSTKDPREVVRVCQLLEPTFGAINLEDIRAPECFEIEEELRRTLGIPVFHDDQHGTAIISGAGLLNAVDVAGKKIDQVRVVFSGAGAAAIACAEHFIRLGVRRDNIIMCDTKGVIFQGRREGINRHKERFARETEARTLADALRGADVFFGFSAADCVTPEMLLTMSDNPVVFALANPNPEIPYDVALKTRSDLIMATGRSDFPNQVNNVLGFPSIFRGALDVRATAINEEMQMAATQALAELARQAVPDSVRQIYGGERLEFGRAYIIPKPFDPRVLIWGASVVAKAALATGVARVDLDIEEYKEQLARRLGVAPEVMRVMIRKAQARPQRVVFPEGEENKILRASQVLIEERIATPILIGNRKRIQSKIAARDLHLDGVEIVDLAGTDRLSLYSEELHRRGATRKEAEDLLADPNVLGALMVHLGDADAMISGLSCHYPEVVRPVSHVIPMQKNVRNVSGLYLLISSDGELYLFAGCAVKIDPAAEDLAEIAVCAAEMARRFNVAPKVAMLPFPNSGTSRHPWTERVRKAVQLVQERRPGLMVDGEIHADTASVPETIDEPDPFSVQQGGANVLVFPNLEACSLACKLLARIGKAEVIGPLLIGLSKPIHVLEKGAAVHDIVNVAAVAVVAAQEE